MADAVFDGPTQSSSIPQLPENFPFDASFPAIDAGVIVVDTRCCDTNFGIADREPNLEVTGVMRFGSNLFPNGVALTRGSGRWTARACFPVNSASTYWYQFTWDAGVVDAGVGELDDGGLVNLSYVDIKQVVRASDEEPGVEAIDGTRSNTFRAVSSCDGLDGSVPR